MAKLNVAAIQAAGYTVNDQGMVFEGSKRIKNELIPHIEAGMLVANVNIEEVKAAKARQAQSGSVDLVTAITAISPVIPLLGVGQTAKVAIPAKGADGKDPKRSFVMGIVTKLNNLTVKGREWAGRNFDVVSDETGENVYVVRTPDGEPRERKAPTRKADASKDNLNNALNKTQEHLQEGGQPKDDAIVIEN